VSVGAGGAAPQALRVLYGFDSPPADLLTELLEGSDGALYGTTRIGGVYSAGTVFKVNRDGTGFLKLHDFHIGDPLDGGYPFAELIEGSDGALYGTTSAGGASSYGKGIVFKIRKDGTGFAKLHDFLGGDPANGAAPYAGLIEASDGALYGTTLFGGAYDDGIAFKINKDGTGFLNLHDFDVSDPANGAFPPDGLREGSDGALYGNAAGGSYRGGVVYRIDKDGTGFEKLHDFSPAADGNGPIGKLTEGADGALYGVTNNGGLNGYGTVFGVRKDGTGFLKLRDLSYQDGGYPNGGLIEGTDSVLYGMSSYGGAQSRGAAFKINKDGSGFLKIHEFSPADGSGTGAGLIEGTDGALYGTTREGGLYNLGVAFKVSKDGSGFSRVHDFSPSVGAVPYSRILAASNGALYGTTYSGGAHGSGIIFRIRRFFRFSRFQTLHVFDYANPANGSYPRAGLIEASDGALYGTTSRGGAANAGIVFRISKDGTGFVKVHQFKLSDPADGTNPWSAVLEGSDGALYGTTFGGGALFGGVVFKMNKDGSGFRILHSFQFGVPTNGSFPRAGVIEGTDGALYGTTYSGGAHGEGIAFRVSKDGSGFLTLHDFNIDDPADGAYPEAPLLEASTGEIFGTTSWGGAYNQGAAFKINKDGTGFVKVFDFQLPGGAYPGAGFIDGADGALYGTTTSGGTRSAGTIFRMNKDGTGFLELHGFGFDDGAWPYAELCKGSRGVLYGTTSGRGPLGGGVVFAFTTQPR
jgi:uncharacterized repeat protein (TIGR03803 family)